jgi:hypothetical protein
MHLRSKSIESSPARRAGIAAAVAAFVGIISFSKATNPDAIPIECTEKVLATPHFFQCDPRGQFPGNGRDYCGPTAVSDSLMYLASHGFPNLLPDRNANAVDSQISLINVLAQDCMNTDPANGTNASEACLGISRYVEACGYECKQIEYRGWMRMGRRTTAYQTDELPTLDWIKQAVANPHGAAWVNVGWYVRGDNEGEWRREGGHWLAVVGYGVDANGQEDPSVLLVDNPAIPTDQLAPADTQTPRHRLADGTPLPTNDEIAQDVMTTVQVSEGRLINKEGRAHDADGLYGVLGPGVSRPGRYDGAFIDGALVMVIGSAEAGRR